MRRADDKAVLAKHPKYRCSIGRAVAAFSIFCLGLSVLLYPHAARYVNNLSATELVAGYERAVSQMESQMGELSSDSLGTASSRTALNNEDIFATLFIPKLNLDLPIYTGSTTQNLSQGIAHLEGTSLPVGGESTHAVLAGHNGVPNHEWFTNIDRLQKGDLFYIRHEGVTLTYQVTSSNIINPNDTTPLFIQEGKDLVTLLTCAQGGAKRLVVTGSRLADSQNEKQ